MKKVMVVDDDARLVTEIASLLEKEGYTAVPFTSSITAMKALGAVRDVDLVVSDIRMPDAQGTEIISTALSLKRPVPVIILTGFGDIDTAVNIMKAGASDFLTKPVSSRELIIRIKKVIERQALSEEVERLRKKLETAEGFHSIVGRSKRMEEVYGIINSVASTDATVLIRGETGTGKELVARAIHDASDRKEDPFVAISCTAVQHTLLESEFFGHEKGAFTGAHALKQGKFELAGKGTVFLDEIGDTSAEIQAKLLRVLQEREFERVGGSRPIRLYARVLAATNMDLEDAVREGRFREDLYYRLNVVEVNLPPLREREEDIITLADHFLEVFRKRYDKPIEGFSPAAIEQILDYGWPGNVRELRNAIERTVLTNPRRWIDRVAKVEPTRGAGGVPSFKDLPARMPYPEAKDFLADELEKAYLIKYMKEERGQINRVAELMGVCARTVARQLEKHGLDKSTFKRKEEAGSKGLPL